MKKVLIIGLGNIGILDDEKKKNIYTTHSKSLSKSRFFKVIGCIDLKKKNSLKAKSLYGFKIYRDIQEAITVGNPDLIVISSDAKHHFLIIKELFKHKTKITIFCEKPAGHDLNSTIKIRNICNKNQSECFVNYQRRSFESSFKVKKIINSNKKKQCKGSVLYTNGIKNSASHYINLFQFYFGRIVRIKKLDSKFYKKLNDFNGDFILYFKKAVIYFLYSDKNKFNYAFYSLNFDKFKINYSNGKNYIQIIKNENSDIFNKKLLIDGKIEKIKSETKNYQLDVYSQIENYFKNKHYELCDINEALDTMRIINKII